MRCGRSASADGSGEKSKVAMPPIVFSLPTAATAAAHSRALARKHTEIREPVRARARAPLAARHTPPCAANGDAATCQMAVGTMVKARARARTRTSASGRGEATRRRTRGRVRERASERERERERARERERGRRQLSPAAEWAANLRPPCGAVWRVARRRNALSRVARLGFGVCARVCARACARVRVCAMRDAASPLEIATMNHPLPLATALGVGRRAFGDERFREPAASHAAATRRREAAIVRAWRARCDARPAARRAPPRIVAASPRVLARAV